MRKFLIGIEDQYDLSKNMTRVRQTLPSHYPVTIFVAGCVFGLFNVHYDPLQGRRPNIAVVANAYHRPIVFKSEFAASFRVFLSGIVRKRGNVDEVNIQIEEDTYLRSDPKLSFQPLAVKRR